MIAKNLHRRHLKEQQRAMVASKIETLKHGDNQHTNKNEEMQICISSVPKVSRKDAASLLNVSPRS